MLESCLSVVRHQLLGFIALIVALGGTSYAVVSGSIDSRAIKDNSVRGKDVRNNTVRSRDVRNRSLLTKDFKRDQLPAGPRGATGLRGPRGLTGVGGPPGPTMGDIEGAADAFLVPPDQLPFEGRSNTVSLPKPGRLLVMYIEHPFQVDCVTPNPEIALFVDGVPVPGTARTLQDDTPEHIDIFGVSGQVAAGDHAVAVGVSCPGAGAPVAFSGSNNRHLGAVLLGS